MSSRENNPKKRENIAKLVLMVVFLGGLGIFTFAMQRWGVGLSAFKLSWLDLVLLAFSTYRLGHLVAYDQVVEPLRSYFTKTVPDATGAGDTVEPKGEGVQQALGQLISCPICAGTWVAAVLVCALYLWPDPTRVFITIMAAIGAAEFLNAAGEALSWSGQYHRTISGAQMAARKKNIVLIEQPCEEIPIAEREEARSMPRSIKKKVD